MPVGAIDFTTHICVVQVLNVASVKDFGCVCYQMSFGMKM